MTHTRTCTGNVRTIAATIMTLGISLTTGIPCARADGLLLPGAALTSGRLPACTQAFIEALNDPAHPTPLNASPSGTHPETSAPQRPLASDLPACNRHPWLRQLRQWWQAGMTVETAMQWRVAPPDHDTDPLMTGELADLARMQAAFSLAKSGLADEARPLWIDLSLRRPAWAEVWFNLGICAWLTGHPEAADHFKQASALCQNRSCSIPQSLLLQWLARTGGQP